MAWTLVILLGVIAAVLLVLLLKQSKQLARFTRTQQQLPIAAGAVPNRRKVDYHKPVILMAHRGLARYATENSGPAIALAADAGANGIELDIRFTADHVPVLFHDRSLHVLAGRPQSVRALSWSQLANIAVSPANRIIRLDGFLAEFAGRFDRVLLDLKDFRSGGADRQDVDQIAAALRRHDAAQHVIVDSSSLDCARYAQEQGLTASLREPTQAAEQLIDMDIRHVSLPAAAARSFYEQNANWAGLAVTAICPPQVDEAMWFIERDAFAVITDLVEETLEAMASRGYATAAADGGVS